jgi:hypothetical protein
LQRLNLESDYETLPRFFWRYEKKRMIPSPEKNFPFAFARGDRADNFSDSDERTGGNKGLIKCRFLAD